MRVDSHDHGHRELVDRYFVAFERYDVDALTALLQEDATLSMPPFTSGSGAPTRSGPGSSAEAPTAGARAWCRPTPSARPASVSTGPSPNGGPEPWALKVLEISDGRIAHLNSFLDTQRFFPLFGLPPRLDA